MIDDLTSALSVGFSVTDSDLAVYDPSRPHPRFSEYKNNNFVKKSQEKRRRELLERQKEKRFNAFSTARHLDESYDDDENCDESPMDVGQTQKKHRNKSHASRQHKDCVNFLFKLMLSEWLVDVPENFAKDYFMMPCPEGKRCLIVANQGETREFSKSGYERSRFQSLLPGGNKKSRRHVTWLDCVYSVVNSTFYVLDVIQWANVSLYDGDREFRYFWVQQKFAEITGIGDRSATNRNPFVLLPQCLCTNENMSTTMNEEFPFKVDGLLFYCTEAHYSAGLTPLVGWLKPFMMKEILNVNVPEKYANQGVGTTTAQFIDEFTTKQEEKQTKNNQKIKQSHAETSMEIEASFDETNSNQILD